MSRKLYDLGRWCALNRRWVLVSWLAAFVLLVGAMLTVGGHVTETFSLPGTESQTARDLLNDRFPVVSGSGATVVVSGSDLDGSQRGQVQALAASIAKVDGVASVGDPYGPFNISPNGEVLQFSVRFPQVAQDVDESTFEELEAVVHSARSNQMMVEVGGEVATEMARSDPGGGTEMLGLGVAMIVLVLTLGSLTAMGLTLFTALLGVGTSISSILLVARFFEIPSIAETLGLMLGLAVGIDYALFVLSRHREQLQSGMDVTESIGRSLATAGGAVVFAGSTVVIAMLGLIVVGIPFITIMSLSVAFAVILAVSIAVTLLPAMLGFAGTKIVRVTVPGLRTRATKPQQERAGTRWTRAVTRRPWLSFLGGLLLIGVMAVPVLDMETAMPSDAGAPESSSRRQAYDLVSDGFGPGFNGPFQIVIDHQGLDPETAEAALEAIRFTLESEPGVLAVSPPTGNPAGDTTILTAIPTSGPTDPATTELIERLRQESLPGIAAAQDATIYVAGPTAVSIDINDKLMSRLPWVMTVIIGLTFLVLMMAFRSLLVPLKAAIGILLSIGASFGVVVAVFQWGWGASLIGIDSTQPLISFLPVMAFAILFGLSMDYEVFILSRVREEWLRTDNAHDSVVNGVGMTARVITAAAAIMISVFGGFMLGDDPSIKMVGLGLSVAVLIDATIVRMILVPSTMVMFDRANWWLPGWLDRLLPDVDIEGQKLLAELEIADSNRNQPDR